MFLMSNETFGRETTAYRSGLYRTLLSNSRVELSCLQMIFPPEHLGVNYGSLP